MAQDEVVKRLDTVIAILRLAHRDELENARTEILGDKTNKAILDLSTDWQAAGQLQKAVRQKTKESGSTVKRRLAALVDLGVLERRGSGPSVAYRSTGLI